MESSLLANSLQNLGVGVAAVVILYLCFKASLTAFNERDKAFRDFVEANNHRSVEIMTECRDVIHQAAENIKQSTEIQKQVIDYLIKSNK
jgi:hypothetical protein